MLKSTASRFLLGGGLTCVCVFAGLALAGRSMGTHPLPWRVAPLAPLGRAGLNLALHLAIRDGNPKARVIEAYGKPPRIIRGGKLESSPEIDLNQNFESEYWIYPPFVDQRGHRAVLFKYGVVSMH